jgi:hypothetical protein
MNTSWRCTLLGHAWQPYATDEGQVVEYCQRCGSEQTTVLMYAGPGAGMPRLVQTASAQWATTR